MLLASMFQRSTCLHPASVLIVEYPQPSVKWQLSPFVMSGVAFGVADSVSFAGCRRCANCENERSSAKQTWRHYQVSPGPPLANSSEAPERSHSRAPSASLQKLWDASLMRSRLAFKKVRPEDCGLRQKASQVYAGGGLAGTGRPSTRFQRSTGIFVYINDVSRIRAYSGRAPPNDRGQLRTLPRRDRGRYGLGTVPPARSRPETI